jgi:PAS domain S-box-containing protein
MSTAFQIDSEFAVVLLTQDGSIVDAHPTCKDSLGWSREELIGKDIGDLLQSDRELLMSQLISSKDAEMGADGQTSFSIRILARRRDETSFPARVVVRRFDQTECCTAAFYRVNPHNDSDTPPIVRSEEIELAMRGNAAQADAAAQPQLEKPKSRWRNARLLFGSKTQPSPGPQPAPVPARSAMVTPPLRQTQPVQPVQPIQQNQPLRPAPRAAVPQFDAQVPEDIFLRLAPEKATSLPKAEPEAANPEAAVEEVEAVASETPAPVTLSESRTPLVEESVTETEDRPSYEALIKQLQEEREERHILEQRASSLTSQVSSLHLQLSEHLEIEGRHQKKVNGLEEQIRESRNQVTQLKGDLATERQKNQAAQEKIEAATTVSTRVTEQLDALKLVHDALSSTQAETERQLGVVNKELKDAQESLAAETAKRQQLELSLTSAQQERGEQERKLKLELSKLETALKAKELELKEHQVQQAQETLQAKS